MKVADLFTEAARQREQMDEMLDQAPQPSLIGLVDQWLQTTSTAGEGLEALVCVVLGEIFEITSAASPQNTEVAPELRLGYDLSTNLM
jgi:hypothetical protein